VAGLAALGVLTATGGVAIATPKPTVASVKKKLRQLSTRADRLDQQLNQAEQDLTSANRRLRIVNRQARQFSRQFKAMRTEVGRIAVQAYTQGSMTSSVALLTSANPQQILDKSSMLTELSSSNKAHIDQFLAAAHNVTTAQATARHTRAGILKLKTTLRQHHRTLVKLIASQKALLARLKPPQRVGTGPGGGSSGGGSSGGSPPPYTGPTGTQAQKAVAQKAVAFAYAQIGKPYLWGASGPDSFDCSGLMMAAWASAGVSIPRVSYSQMSSLPSVPLSALQPGDIIGFNGNSHVGMYVGNGFIIDAPHSGADVEKIAFSGWYRSTADGAVRP
jgi:peptidoglycan DL-endopeptidase CwlO